MVCNALLTHSSYGTGKINRGLFIDKLNQSKYAEFNYDFSKPSSFALRPELPELAPRHSPRAQEGPTARRIYSPKATACRRHG